MIVASFLAFLLAFLLIGIASYRHSRGTTADYYLASRTVSPSLVGLSAVATNNSGYMFIGVIGYTYTAGLSSIWLMFGWIAGDLVASLAAHRELRAAAGRTQSLTLPGVLASWSGTEFRRVRRVAGALTVLLLGAYAAAQLAAGGKALHALFGWSTQSGAMLVAAVVAAYCLAGGIRASIWTDAAQAFVMLVAMGLLLIVAVDGLGGPTESWNRLAAVPDYMNWFPSDLLLPGAGGMLLFVVGWFFAGLSVIGQPHILVRFMALDSPAGLWRARAWYYGFFTVFYAMATGVGLLSRIYLPDLGAMDPELALPTIAQQLLPPVLVGLILAGIFAATMSTADSLVLSCSASLAHDLGTRSTDSVVQSKVTTLLVTALALAIALAETGSVFALVILAWSTMASALAPLLVVQARGHRPAESTALAMMAVGVAIAIAWRQAGWHEQIYEGFPGIVGGLLTFYALHRGRAATGSPTVSTAEPPPK